MHLVASIVNIKAASPVSSSRDCRIACLSFRLLRHQRVLHLTISEDRAKRGETQCQQGGRLDMPHRTQDPKRFMFHF